MPKFLNDAELKTVLKKTSRSPGAAMLPPNATALEKAKFELCRQLLIYMKKQQLTQRELAKQLGVVESRISEIVHYRIKTLTLDRLVKYHQTVDPKFDLKVA